jgi:hypothetical protein
MFIRIAQVCIYILFCTLLRTGPWRYFQLNARYFNHNKGIFSKLDIDQLIPLQWRLPQWVDHSGIVPDTFPVFLKPEWGQNSKGIQRADNLAEFEHLRLLKPNSKIQYLVQQGAKQNIEFEIFIIPAANSHSLASISITQVSNLSDEQYPINGIYNAATQYCDISSQFSGGQKQTLYETLRTVGQFNICRFAIRANSIDDLINANFSIIEINLFFPMPLILLCNNVSLLDKWSFIIRNMWLLARVTKSMINDQPYKDIFFKKMGVFYQIKDFKQKEMS